LTDCDDRGIVVSTGTLRLLDDKRRSHG
jgi:hypothetical protein